jgi:tRNA-splicing ligase RtcB (3'-phosphate/5'-hydroxy nucleic acid ligase)
MSKKVIREEGARPIKAWVGMKIGGESIMPNGLTLSGNVPDKDCLEIDIEDAALTQLKNIARLPFIHHNGVAAMPDVHMGVGASVGTVIATDKAIIPSAVGVDIGCGMVAVRLSLKAHQLPDSLKEIRNQIERDVPLGKGGKHNYDTNEAGNRTPVSEKPVTIYKIVRDIFGGDFTKFINKAGTQMGTLGSGNHFIELCTDENDDVWVMLHSGSRGIGNMIGSYFIEKAKRRMEQYFITLPDGDLAYLPEDTDEFNDYVEAVGWAQNYAFENREAMMKVVIEALRKHIPTEFTITEEAINCHHNYVERENHFGKNLWVTRKGAIRARKGDLGIIPGSMGQKSYIVRGKGDIESYCSCSHGAGRKMSRTEARRKFTVADLKAQTKGVECPKTDAVLDEIPSSYKDLDLVMHNQRDLIEVVHTLKAILNVKGV